MQSKRLNLLSLAVMLVLTGSAFAQRNPVAPHPAPKPQAPVKPTPEPYALDPDLLSAVDAKDLKSVIDKLHERIASELTDVKNADPVKLVPLAASWQFAKYFSRIEAPSGEHWAALQKLSRRPHFATRLLLGLDESDAPDRVLDVASAVCNEDNKKRNCDDWPDLAAALCVVWDLPSGEGQQEDAKADARHAALLFRFYTNVASRLKFDPRTLPFELLTYVVDNPIDQSEIAWAFTEYGRRASVGGIYFDVPYDTDALYGIGERKIKGAPLTLQELRLRGGVCIDQAYFATMVGRSLGVPSVVSTGRGSGSDGTGHAWVGYLDRSNKIPFWNFTDGRYASQQYFRGDVSDPQSRLTVPESEVALSAESLKVNTDDRLTSAALVACAGVVDEARRAELYMRAASLYVGNRAAWQGLADLGARRVLDRGQLDKIAAAVTKALVPSYPEFALEILTKLNAGRGSQQQFAALERMKELVKARPDLLADLTLAQGDVRRREKKYDEALRLYGSVIDGKFSMGPIVLAGMERIDALLTEQEDAGRLADMYRAVWARMPTPEMTIAVRGAPYYVIGRRYASTLAQFNTDVAKAELARVEAKLESLDAAVASSGR